MIDWLIAERGSLPPAEHVLAPPEMERYLGLRTEKRRQDWLLGHWAAKLLLRRHMAGRGFDLPLQSIMVLNDADGAPHVMPWGVALTLPCVAAELEALQISISHTEGLALCALIARPLKGSCGEGQALPEHLSLLGADIERVAARGAAFAESYDTEQELALLAAAPPHLYDTLATAIWSAKEATLKLTRHGLRADTRAVTCLPAPPAADGWATVAISTDLSGAPLMGWWREHHGCVVAIVAERGRA
jgi:4'-phosphopantetheinyl transferase